MDFRENCKDRLPCWVCSRTNKICPFEKNVGLKSNEAYFDVELERCQGTNWGDDTEDSIWGKVEDEDPEGSTWQKEPHTKAWEDKILSNYDMAAIEAMCDVWKSR